MAKLIVGLGNIGKEYENTNHNMGFMAVDLLAEKYNVKVSKNMCNSMVGEFNKNGEKIILAKPTIYMNASGIAVKSLISKFGIDMSKDMIIISDDIDLDTGKVRLRSSGSAGTHNGLKSVIKEIQSTDFIRLRVGVGKPPEYMSLVDFVTAKFTDKEGIQSGLNKAAEALDMFICGSTLDQIMQKVN